ncbi:MAG: DUF4270 family protein [Bacteroidota bacterium]
MKHLRIILRLLAASWIFALLFVSCKQDEQLGLEVQPPEDRLGVCFTDTCSVFAYSVWDKAIRTDEALYNVIGCYRDPIFGLTTACSYTQFHMPENALTFGTNPVPDSLVLCLAYAGQYGDSTEALTFFVNEIAENLYLDSAYHSDDKSTVFKNVLGTKTFVPKIHDSVFVDGINNIAHLRIKLSQNLAQKFIDASGTSDLADNTSFVSFFKGLRISSMPEFSSGSVQSFGFLSSGTKLVLYYHNDSDTTSQKFVIDEKCARYNAFEHYGYGQADPMLKNQILNGDTLAPNSLYLQAMGGLKVKLQFPHILDLVSKNQIAIDKAVLVVKVDETTIGTLNPPVNLALIKINNDGTFSFLPDQYFGTSYFGGSYDASTHEYRFTISKYIQDLLLYGSGYDKGLYLAVSGAAIYGNRVVINGSGNTNGKLRLEITYTKIN